MPGARLALTGTRARWDLGSPGLRHGEGEEDEESGEDDAREDVDAAGPVDPVLAPRRGHRPHERQARGNGGEHDRREPEVDERAGGRDDDREQAAEQHPVLGVRMRVAALPVDPALGERPSPPPGVAGGGAGALSGRNGGSRSGRGRRRQPRRRR